MGMTAKERAEIKKEFHGREVERIDHEISNKKNEREKLPADDVENLERINLEIEQLEIDMNRHGQYWEQYDIISKSYGNDDVIVKFVKDIESGNNKIDDAYERFGSELEMSDLKDENLTLHAKTYEMMEEFWKTYKADSKTTLWLAVGGVAGSLIFGIVGFGLAAASLYYAINPKPAPPSPPQPATPSGTNSGARGPDSLAAEVSGDISMTEEEIEDMMQQLVSSKALIAGGKVSQEQFWRKLAEVADQSRIEDQNLTLVFVQQASIDLPGRSTFFWLDPSEAKQQYNALHAAYKKSGKLADVYVAAAQMRYESKEVPMFHVATLIQCALHLIKFDRLSATSARHG